MLYEVCHVRSKFDILTVDQAEADPTMAERLRRNKYITRTRLRSIVGATALTLLGEPDLERRNPHYSTMPPMQLYRVGRVEDFLKIRILIL